MSGTICPWWLGNLLAHPLRRRIHDPASIVGPFVSEGMTVVEYPDLTAILYDVPIRHDGPGTNHHTAALHQQPLA
jgi:hypothetical protein